MAYLLHPGVLGVMVMSLLAAFMSTVDTHINWGASYIVNDVYLRMFPDAPPRRQIRAARLSVLGFVVLAVLVSFQIATIEQAWKWVATLGAALGVPTMLRWVWWRVNATSELAAMAFGLATAALLSSSELAYEVSIVLVSAASLLGMGVGIAFGPPTAPEAIQRFVAQVRPHGFWPGKRVALAFSELSDRALRWAAIVAAVTVSLFAIHRLIFTDEALLGVVAFALAVGLVAWGSRSRASAPR